MGLSATATEPDRQRDRMSAFAPRFALTSAIA